MEWFYSSNEGKDVVHILVEMLCIRISGMNFAYKFYRVKYEKGYFFIFWWGGEGGGLSINNEEKLVV